MPKAQPGASTGEEQRRSAMARWDTEGGAGPDGPQKHDPLADAGAAAIRTSDVELGQLHARMIVLENVVIAMLAIGCNGERDLVRAMAASTSSEQETAPSASTADAARHLLSLIERADGLTMATPARRKILPDLG
jgi:hypothetical protein